MADPKKTAPQPADYWPELAPVREAALQGRMMIGRCTQCREPHAYARALCPFCLAPAAFEEVSGEGEIYSFSTLRRGPAEPSLVAYVTLREGPSVVARIVTDDPDRLAIGQSVRLFCISNEGGDLAPQFSPIQNTEKRP